MDSEVLCAQQLHERRQQRFAALADVGYTREAPQVAQCLAVCRRAKLVARGTSRPRRGARLCRRWALQWREDGELLGQCWRATKCEKWSDLSWSRWNHRLPRRQPNPERLLLDARGVDVTRAYNAILHPAASLKWFFSKALSRMCAFQTHRWA